MATYYLYQIRNNLNGKIYIGVHSTSTENDTYMGSGTLISNAIQKYGKDNFTKTILEYFNSEEEMYFREAEIVDKEFVLREDTYNIALGGVGGWTKSNEVIARKRMNDSEWYEKKRENISKGVRKALAEGKCKCATKEFNMKRTQKSLLPEFIEKRKNTYAERKHQQGENHALYGRTIVHKKDFGWIWVSNTDLPEYVSNGWVKGKGKQKRGVI